MEKKQYESPSTCPKCGATDQVDLETSEIDGDVMRQSAICGECECEFTEISQVVYLYTEIYQEE
jgi:transcription elongation factor Elf1